MTTYGLIAPLQRSSLNGSTTAMMPEILSQTLGPRVH